MNTKSLLSLLLAIFALSGLSVKAASPNSANDAYSKAVVAYIEAANKEMATYQKDADTLAGQAADNERQAFKDVYAKLDRCDQLLKQLTDATPRNFDKLKAEYEKTRADMVKTLDGLRKTTTGK